MVKKKIGRSIKTKLIFLYLTLVFIVMIIVGTYILTSIKKFELEKINREMINYADYIDEQIINSFGDAKDFQSGITNMFYGSKNNMQCNILNSNGSTIASSVLPYENYNNKSVIKALTGRENFSYCHEVLSGKKIKIWYDYARPSKFCDDYLIFIRVDSKEFLDIVFNMTLVLIFSLILALIFGGAIGFLFAGSLTKPIRILSDKAKEMANGNLNHEIIINSDDEIGELTLSFNEMAKKLSNMINKIALENNKLEIILQNMNDGVIFFDANGNVLHYNYASENLLGLDFYKIEKNDFDNVMKKIGLENNNFVACKKKNFSFTDDILKINDKYLALNFIPYEEIKNKELKGILLVIQDVSKHKKLDDMRQEFVANVSHEIRTPLTTIKAYSETLLSGEINDKELENNFLNIINQETDRIYILAKDLLELSKFDNNQAQFDFKKINLCEVINKSIEQNNIEAKKKEQEIKFEQAKDFYYMEGDFNRLNQVFCNLISNAIKYSDKKKKIEIYIKETERYIRVFVKDNGYGIPKEDLNNIFERFYRVDKARSRAMGGTGLGLSIVKKIIEAHDAIINVISELNVGTTMILKFKKFVEQENNFGRKKIE